MHPKRLRLPIVALLFLAAARAPAAEAIDLNRVTPVPATEPIPIADFFRGPLFTDPQLNRAGTHLVALISAAEDRYSLMVYDLNTKQMEVLKGVGDQDVYAPIWLNDQRIVFSLAKEKLYGEGLFAADVGRLSQAYPLMLFCAVQFVGVPDRERPHPLVWIASDVGDGRDAGVAAINSDLNTGSTVDFAKVPGNNQRHILKRYSVPEGGLGAGYLADATGELAFAFTGETGFFTLRRYVADRWEKCPVDLDQINILGCGEKPGELVVWGPRQPGQPRALQFMEGATGRLGEVLFQDKDYDFTGSLYRHPVSHVVVGVSYSTGGPKVVWFSAAYRDIQKMVDAQFPDRVVRILGSDTAEQRFLIGVYSDRQPIVYYALDLAKRTLGLVKNSMPWIDPTRMRTMDILKFKTRDGRQLDAYVTLPAGASKQHPVPLVVLPHGGPYVRDTWGFNGEVQFLASLGYAVLQPNYRGSPGYDWMFPEEDLWDFRKMHDDVTDATRTLLASGLVDPKRVAVMGGSFGGYLAVSGVANEPELYCCAVTIDGVFDWAQIVKEQKYYQYDNPRYAYMIRKLGDPRTEKEKFAAISPVRHVDQIHVPIFVAHGKDDPVVSVSESRRLISELEKYHVPHETLLVSREGHGMSHLRNQVELYTRIEEFLKKNLAP